MCILVGILLWGTTTAANFSIKLKSAAVYIFVVNVLMLSHSDVILTQCGDATRRALAINIEKFHVTFSQQPTGY